MSITTNGKVYTVHTELELAALLTWLRRAA